MFANSRTIETNAVRSLSLDEVDSVAGGYVNFYTDISGIGSRQDVGCGTMILIDRLIKWTSGKLPR